MRQTFEQPIETEVLIIGGGPAGCAAAIQLAMAGRNVCLLERKPAAHEKVCGEFISGEAAYYLRKLDINLERLGAVSIQQLRIFDQDDGSTESVLPFPAWSLSRGRLDAALLNKARAHGVRLYEGLKAQSLEREAQQWRIEASSIASDESCSFFSPHVFLATGKQDLRQWRRPTLTSNDGFIGLKMHMELAPAQQRLLTNTVEIYIYDGGYVGLEPIENDRANLCFLIAKDTYQACNGDWTQVLDHICQCLPTLAERLQGAQSLWSRPLAVSNTPYGFVASVEDTEPGLYRLGDQAAVIPSYAGDGIAIALHTGLFAAKCVLKSKSAAYYQARAAKLLRRPVRNAQWLEEMLAHKTSRNIAFGLSRQFPSLIQLAARATRVSDVASYKTRRV